MDPTTLSSSGWLALVDGMVVAPSLPTCNGSTYDYFVVSKGLLPAVVGIHRVDDAGLLANSLSLATPSRLLLRGDARRFAVRQVVRPKRVEPILPFRLAHQEAAIQRPGHRQRHVPRAGAPHRPGGARAQVPLWRA